MDKHLKYHARVKLAAKKAGVPDPHSTNTRLSLMQQRALDRAYTREVRKDK